MLGLKRLKVITAAVIVVLNITSPSQALGSGKTYDMSRFLNEPYPFASTTVAKVQPIPIKSSRRNQNSPVVIKTAAPKVKNDKLLGRSASLKSNTVQDRWLSEIRIGALKHAVSLIGNTTKETGMDANVELLFEKPRWLEFLWSPRPMTGVSANASSTSTDIAYTGLTWEWTPLSNLILDFSFGFAIHNGKLKYDAAQAFPEDSGRHREFGCRWLFRETLEAGWLFANRHATTVMWSHYSHGGLCDDKNEGLDNVGIRYGYRF